ncbi:uncharacterized protein [Cicer arietinum]|uniref:Uncharacterized protein LOC101502942 isoform X2 n=1 Tax=Cicer arietinum TaxID=3827 RepID=A0A1S2XP85_CICAR|nr:uncharacterized protein LOC101502942 isoform X2 [Cicer arietinum]
MMICSEDLAIKPCGKKSSHHRLQNHMHKVCIKSQQKRKFARYINSGIFTTSFELIDNEKNGCRNAKYQRRSSSSPFSCSTLLDEKQIVQRTKEQVFLALNDKEEYCCICKEDYSHLSDNDDSIEGPSYPMYLGNFKIQPRDLMASGSFPLSTKTSIKDKPKMEFVKVLKSLVHEEEDIELICTGRKFLPSRSNHLPRPVIPIGPRFQAKVPIWEDRSDIKQQNDDDSLKWLGTQIWPLPIISKTNTNDIGKSWSESMSHENA